MRRISIYLAVFLLFQAAAVYFIWTKCISTPTIYLSTGDRYADLERRAHLIHTLHHKVMKSSGKKRAKYERLYFNVYPSSYIQFYTLYSGDKVHGPFLKSENIDENIDPWQDWHQLFHNLKSINKEEYYNRMIDLDVGGWWGADQFYSNIGEYLSTDTALMVELLARRSSEEMRSVFMFMYDGPHHTPEYHENFARLHAKVAAINKDMASTMKLAYEIQSSRVH